MKNKNLFNRKDLKSYRLSLRNRFTSAEAELWDNLKLNILMEGNSEDNIVLVITLLTSVVLKRN
jgi:hypothetical protein